ncbi:MAG: TonB-dependent receptor, partial [Sphingomonadaceae bacterium]
MTFDARSPQAVSPAFLALGCVGFLTSAPALAQAEATAANTQRLGGVTVEATAIEDSLRVDRVESPKATRPLLDTPQTITVISNQNIRQQNLLTLRDVLTTVPGITFGAGEGGGGYGDSINLRGYSANNDITLDGMRDSAQYSRTDPFNTQQIEVYNGANSVFNGSGAIGGTINITSKVPQADDLTVLEGGVGTDDYYRATLDTNHRVNEFIAVRLNAMYHENDVPGRDVERYERWGIAPSVTLGIDSPTSLTLSYVHQEDDNIPTYGVPYVAALGGLLPGARYSGYYGYANVDGQTITLDRATAIFRHTFSDAVSIRNLARWQRVYQKSIVNPPQGTYCLLSTGLTQTGAPCPSDLEPGFYQPSGPRGTTRISENDTFYNQTDLTAVFDTGGLEHTLVIGASFMKESYDLTQGSVQRNADGTTPTLPIIEIANPNTLYDGPINFIASSIQGGELSNKAVYLFDTVKLSEMLELNAGLRYENSNGNFSSVNPTTGVALLSDSDEDLFSYRFGAVFKPAPNASLYIAYGNSKSPSLATVRLGCVSNNAGDFCDAAPESAVNYEIGGKIDLLDSLQLTAALFRNERTNYRVPSNDPSIPDPQVLDGRARVDGIALGAAGNVTPEWAIFANYTYLDSKVLQSISDENRADGIVDIQRGNPLENTPKHSGSLFTTYTLPFGLQ